ncbi:MAG: hypothetical protein D8G53_11625 [Candidatus Saccharimonas sp.]|nr:MAG: hypothetical protein D8G53_11625 [Candidatus Saccharimonas sp.]
MPRRNRTPKHQRYRNNSARAPEKKRFASRSDALRAIRELQKYHLGLRLTCYQSPVDGGWYLTSYTSSVQ